MHLLGAGRAGATLAHAWQQQGLADIGLIRNRSETSAQAAAERIGAGTPVTQWMPAFAEQYDRHPDQSHWVMLAVPDGHLADAAGELSGWLIDAPRPALAFHISGQLDNGALAALAQQDIVTASAHPVLAFAQPDTAYAQLRGSYCVISAGEAVYPPLAALFEGIGMQCLGAPPELDKSAYHAAMVCASNFTCALQYLAAALTQQAGLPADSARRLLTDLSQRTLASIAEHGPLAALTGPIERGDEHATRRWLRTLDALPAAQRDCLRALAGTVVQMAQDKHSISDDQATALRQLLTD